MLFEKISWWLFWHSFIKKKQKPKEINISKKKRKSKSQHGWHCVLEGNISGQTVRGKWLRLCFYQGCKKMIKTLKYCHVLFNDTIFAILQHCVDIFMNKYHENIYGVGSCLCCIRTSSHELIVQGQRLWVKHILFLYPNNPDVRTYSFLTVKLFTITPFIIVPVVSQYIHMYRLVVSVSWYVSYHQTPANTHPRLSLPLSFLQCLLMNAVQLGIKNGFLLKKKKNQLSDTSVRPPSQANT